jgi:hypothetical protein
MYSRSTSRLKGQHLSEDKLKLKSVAILRHIVLHMFDGDYPLYTL